MKKRYIYFNILSFFGLFLFVLIAIGTGESESGESESGESSSETERSSKDNETDTSSSSDSSSSSYTASCSYSGAESFAKKRAGYALSQIYGVDRINIGHVQSMGYDSDYAFLIDGINDYGLYSIITLLLSCSNGNYSIDMVEAN